MKLYAAQIEILLPADSEAEACDTLSEIFTHYLVYNDVFKDWQYLKIEKTSPLIEMTEEEAKGQFVEYRGAL